MGLVTLCIQLGIAWCDSYEYSEQITLLEFVIYVSHKPSYPIVLLLINNWNLSSLWARKKDCQ